MKIHSTRGFDDASLHYIQLVASNRQSVPPQIEQSELTVGRGYSAFRPQALELSIFARISCWISRTFFKSHRSLHSHSASVRVSEFETEVYGVTYNYLRIPG